MRRRVSTVLLAALACLGPAAAAVARPDRSVPPVVSADRAFRPPRWEGRRLPNGLQVRVLQRRALPSVHLVWSVSAGAAEDPPGLPGAAALLAEALVHEPAGAGESLAEQLRNRGVLLDVEVDHDAIRFCLQVPSKRLNWALRRLRRSLLRAPEGYEIARTRTLAALARDAGDPVELLHGAARLAVWGPADPHGRPPRGTPASLRAIGLEDLHRFQRRWFRTDRMLVAAAGDVDLEALRRGLGRLKPPSAEHRAPVQRDPQLRTDRAPERRIVLVDRPGSNRATIGMATPLTGDVGPLDPAALVTNELLGGPGYSRLLGALRGESGYAYYARSWIEFAPHGGILLAQATVDADDAAAALRRLLATVEALGGEPTAEELLRARSALRQRLLAGWFETNRSASRAWTRLSLLGLDAEAFEDRLRGIDLVGAEETVAFARRHLQPETLVLLVVGDAGTLRGPLGALGFGTLEVWGAEEQVMTSVVAPHAAPRDDRDAEP